MNSRILFLTLFALLGPGKYCSATESSTVVLSFHDKSVVYHKLSGSGSTENIHEYITKGENEERLSLFIESMKCKTDGEEENVAGLTIKGSSGSEWKICDSFDYSEQDNGLDTYYKFSGDEAYEVIQEGNWNDSIRAYIRVAVFSTADECSDCPHESFCCGGSRQCELKNVGVRCLPLTLKCDAYLDCGRRCDSDESSGTCGGFFFFVQWNFIYTLCTILIFAILIPALVITGINFHRKSQALHQRHNAARQRQERLRVAVSQANDRPPTYTDVQLDVNSLPCFCQATGNNPNFRHDNGQPMGNSEKQRSCNCKGTKLYNVPI